MSAPTSFLHSHIGRDTQGWLAVQDPFPAPTIRTTSPMVITSGRALTTGSDQKRDETHWVNVAAGPNLLHSYPSHDNQATHAVQAPFPAPTMPKTAPNVITSGRALTTGSSQFSNDTQADNAAAGYTWRINHDCNA